MARLGDRFSGTGLSIGVLALTATCALGCRYKIVSGGVLDRRPVVDAAQSVSEIRGLPFVDKVHLRLAGTADLRHAAGSEAGEMRLSGQAQREAKLLALLGLIPFGSDPAAATESLIASQPAGVYLPRARRLEIVAREPFRSEVIEVIGLILGRDLTFSEIVSHELTHALQDQHFGLDPPPSAAGNQDAVLAHAALVEGDATLVGFELGLGGLVTDAEAFLDFARRHAPDMGEGVPSYLQERFKFPYLDGSTLVLALKKEGGWEMVNRAHRNPPRSTEEVLHPEKYLSGDDPPRLPDLSELGLEGFDLIHQDTLGEFGIRVLLAQGDARRAIPAAAGWGGDRAAVFERRQGGGLLLVWVTDWDTAADAVEFHDALEQVLARRDRDPDLATLRESRWTGGERTRHLEVWERRVVLLDGSPECETYHLVQAAWRSAGRVPEPPALTQSPSRPPIDPQQVFEMDPHIPRMVQPGPLVRLGTEAAGATLGGFLQVQGEEGMSIQRMRARATGNVSNLLDLRLHLEMELNGKEPLLQDACMSFAPVSPNLLYLGHFRIGRFRVPFSPAMLQDPEHLPLNQRPMTVEMGPQRRTGLAYEIDLMAHGFPLRLGAGAFEGFPEGAGSGTLAVARMDFAPSFWLARSWDLQIGAAYFYDDLHREEEAGPAYNWHGVNLHAHAGYRGFYLQSELLFVDRLAGQRLETWGWSVTAAAFLLPDFMEVVGRYEELRAPDLPRLRQISAGVNLLYLADRFKMVYNFIQREEDDIRSRRHMIVFQLLL